MKTNLIVHELETGIIVNVENEKDANVEVRLVKETDGYEFKYIFKKLNFDSVLFKTYNDWYLFKKILRSLEIDFCEYPSLDTEYKLVCDCLSGTCIMFKLQLKENCE